MSENGDAHAVVGVTEKAAPSVDSKARFQGGGGLADAHATEMAEFRKYYAVPRRTLEREDPSILYRNPN